MHAKKCEAFLVLGTLCIAAAGCAEAESEGPEAQAAQAGTTDGPVRLELSASAKQYVLGQPVRLALVVTNQRNTPFCFQRIPISGWRPACLFLSTDGKVFSPCEPEVPTLVAKMGLANDTLQPSGSTTYRIHTLYGWGSVKSVDFFQAGRFWIQVRYPLREMSQGRPSVALSKSEVRSNAVEVRITEPKGVDADVFSVLREEAILKFVSGEGASPGTVKKVLELLKTHPKSGYHADLKSSLEAYYRRVSAYPTSQVRSDPELKAVVEELRQWLKIPNLEELPFPDDKRLSAKFTYTSDDAVSMPEICKEVSRLTKVPLSVAPDSADRAVSGGWTNSDLRSFMRTMANVDGYWIREGDGYKLLRRPWDKAKPTESPQ